MTLEQAVKGLLFEGFCRHYSAQRVEALIVGHCAGLGASARDQLANAFKDAAKDIAGIPHSRIDKILDSIICAGELRRASATTAVDEGELSVQA